MLRATVVMFTVLGFAAGAPLAVPAWAATTERDSVGPHGRRVNDANGGGRLTRADRTCGDA